ncbi:glycosyltransferase [Aminivibrio sp.]|uniref:glycosyltransferase n=1 Tax=Aminivibrio sp. TaxID=1872489 RepID=UPI003D971CCE
MKILYINGMHPTPSNTMSGVFVNRRLREIKKLSIDFRVFSPIPRYTYEIEIAKILLGKKRLDYPDYIEKDEIRFEYILTNLNSIDLIRIRTLNMNLLIEKMSNSIAKYIKTEKFDIVHAHWAYPHGAIANKLGKILKIPSVISAHGSDINKQAIKNNRFLKSTLITLEEATQVIFVSSSLRKNATSLGYKDYNSTVIPNGIDSKIFKPMKKIEIKQKLNIKEFCVGFVGNLIPVKRAECLPMIFKEISLINPKTAFLVVGDGILRKKIEFECNKLGIDVRFTGMIPQENVPFYMNAMDVLILPSRSEGWPCVVLEAQACGIPVVGSENGGIPEAVGLGGNIVNEGDEFENRFAKVVIATGKQMFDRESLIKRAVAHDWSIIVQRELKVYENALNYFSAIQNH